MIKLKSLLKEDPDSIEYKGHEISFDDDDAYTFGYDHNGFQILPVTGWNASIKTHGQMFDLNNGKFLGRLWKKRRIISFWQPYPSPSEMKQVIHDIENTETVKRVGRVWVKLKIKMNPTEWLLDQEPTNPGGWEETVLKPLSEYLSSNIIPTQGQFKDHEHEISPLKKAPRSVPKGYGSMKMKGNMPAAQYSKMRYPHVDENILPKKILYSAVILNDKSQTALLDTLKQFLPQGWKTYAHHMTIVFGKGLSKPEDSGKNVELTANEIGISDKCIAVKVSGYDSANKIPHITLAVSPDGKPKDSNDITEWQPIQPIVLYGTIEEVR